MCASHSLNENVVRGLVGALAFLIAAWMGTDSGWLWTAGYLGFGALGFVAFRGCPICWTFGLCSIARPASQAKRSEALEDRAGGVSDVVGKIH